MARTTFHRLTIGALVLTGEICVDGPYVGVLDTRTKEKGDAQIGPCSLRHYRPEQEGRADRTEEGWWLVKYGNQPRMLLAGLTAAQAGLVRAEFGLVDDKGKSFYRSNAWLALVSWAAENVTTARRVSRNQAYLPGWHERAQAEAKARGIAPFEPAPKPSPRRRARHRASIIAALADAPVPYGIPSIEHAHGIADRLRSIVNDEMRAGIPEEAVRAMAASLMLSDSWDEALAAAGRVPRCGKDDGQLAAEDLAERRSLQASGLEQGFGMEARWARIIVARTRPTGGPPQDSCPDGCPSAERSGACLSAEDDAVAQEISAAAARFDSAARDVLRINGSRELSMRADAPRMDAEEYIRGHDATDDATGLGELKATREAQAATRDAWSVMAALGPLPFLMPAKHFDLTLRRSASWEMSRMPFAPQGPIEPEPWMDLRLDIAGASLAPTLEWPCRRAARLALGLRRAFLDGGWAGGEPWLVTLQEGTNSIEAHPVLARDGVEAVAWACAARAALNEIRQHPSRSNVRIHAVEGPDGEADAMACVAGAQAHAITQAPWGGASRIKMPKVRATAGGADWETLQGQGKRAVLVRHRTQCYLSSIIVFHDDLGGLMERLHVARTDGEGHVDWMGLRQCAMAEMRDVASCALQGEDPWALDGRWGRHLRADLAFRRMGWNALSHALAGKRAAAP